MTKYLMAALVVAVASTVLALSFPAEAQLQETATAAIDPRIALEIERDGKVKVLISLRDLDELVAVPVAEWTRELALGIDFALRARHAQEVQNNVWSVLGSEDATQISGFKTMPGLAATITAPGLEKLRNHPDVVSIGAAELGSLSLSESGALVSAGVAHAAGYDGSGVTIAAARGLGFDRPSAARFALLLSAPVVLGAVTLQLVEALRGDEAVAWGPLLLGAAVSSVAGAFVIRGLLAYLESHTLRLFVWYRIALGLAVIGASAMGAF